MYAGGVGTNGGGPELGKTCLYNTCMLHYPPSHHQHHHRHYRKCLSPPYVKNVFLPMHIKMFVLFVPQGKYVPRYYSIQYQDIGPIMSKTASMHVQILYALIPFLLHRMQKYS